MNIAQISTRYPPAPGGVETYVKVTTSLLKKRGHLVDVYTSNLYTEIPWKKLEDNSNGAYRLKAFSMPGEMHYPLMPSLIYLPLLKKYDIFHIHTFGTFQATLIPWYKKLGRKVVLSSHYHPPESMWGGQKRMGLRLFYDKHIAKYTIKNSDAIIVESEYEKKEILKFYDKAKVKIIPPGTNVSWLMEERHCEFKKSLGINNRYLLYVGRIASNKGLYDLLNAFKAIQKKIDLSLVIVGPDSGLLKNIKEKIYKEGIQNVYLTGYLSQNQLACAYKEAFAFVFPSHFEAFGLVLLDAMASGLPIITTITGGIPDLVSNNEGILVPPGNWRELANAIEQLYKNEEARKQYIKNSLGKVTYYTWDRVVSDLEKLYDEVINQ